MKVLVIGASGLFGSACVSVLSKVPEWDVYGTIRNVAGKKLFPADVAERLVPDIDAIDPQALECVIKNTKPDVVINCAGLTKHISASQDALQAIPVNSLLPHRLASLTGRQNARLIHISTDCIFSGTKGKYLETDPSDADDIYGKSKYMGEVDYPHAMTVRTSIIGHELLTRHGLLEWFLAQEGQCNGFTKAVFSGLPSVVLAELVRDQVIPNEEMRGVYHIAAEPIAKYDLLKLIAQVYGKSIEIVPDDTLEIDRSLNASKFNALTGYTPPGWPDLIKQMHASQTILD